MSDLVIVEDLRQTKKEAVTRSCNNCGNYQTCTIRTSLPQKVYDMETHKPFTLPEGFISPMACGGELWRKVDMNDVPLIQKLPDETWKQFYNRRETAKSNPQLTELP